MAKKKTNPKGTKVSKPIAFDLTEKEFSEKGQEAASLSKEVRSLVGEFEGIKEDWKAKIKDREAKRDELLTVIHAKKEVRTVDTVMVKDFASKIVQYWFEGEVVEERAMTENEVQMEMELRAPKSVEKKTRVRNVKDPVEEAHQTEVQTQQSDVADVIKEETGRRTKLSAVDGARA